MRRLHIIALAMATTLWGAAAFGQQSLEVPGCGSLKNAYGPYDYRDPTNKAEKLPIVDDNHFTPDVESLKRGITGSVIQELNYTLKAFPNHHRALNAVARYGLSGKKQWANTVITSADCYFQRAVAFTPDDATVRGLYGSYLMRKHNIDAARDQYDEALRLAPNSIEINYNMGLLYLDLGDLERAKHFAEIAYAGGHPLPGLRDKIAAAEARQKKPAAAPVPPTGTIR